jgi:hypothetical protein
LLWPLFNIFATILLDLQFKFLKASALQILQVHDSNIIVFRVCLVEREMGWGHPNHQR